MAGEHGAYGLPVLKHVTVKKFSEQGFATTLRPLVAERIVMVLHERLKWTAQSPVKVGDR